MTFWLRVMAAPLVLSIVPPLITKVFELEPNAVALLMFNVPLASVKLLPAPKVFAPLKVRVPKPVLATL